MTVKIIYPLRRTSLSFDSIRLSGCELRRFVSGGDDGVFRREGFIRTNLNGGISYKTGFIINRFVFKTDNPCVHCEIETLLVISIQVLSFLRILKYPIKKMHLCSPKVSAHCSQQSATSTVRTLKLQLFQVNFNVMLQIKPRFSWRNLSSIIGLNLMCIPLLSSPFHKLHPFYRL